jgi:hypothetical protein
MCIFQRVFQLTLSNGTKTECGIILFAYIDTEMQWKSWSVCIYTISSRYFNFNKFSSSRFRGFVSRKEISRKGGRLKPSVVALVSFKYSTFAIYKET